MRHDTSSLAQPMSCACHDASACKAARERCRCDDRTAPTESTSEARPRSMLWLAFALAMMGSGAGRSQHLRSYAVPKD